ncbi:MAG: hypothetical protein IPK19_14165 [Chloroflexi bacterium]|nr:hypothetical protein [Chloroflexota bacterium]
MARYDNWILDFDDTLAIGPITWAIDVLLPEYLLANGLSVDVRTQNRALQRAQQAAAQDYNLTELIDSFVNDLGLPDAMSLKVGMRQKVEASIDYALFDDTIPFLKRLAANRCTVMIISNNNRAPALATLLDIAQYTQRMLTPNICFNCKRKPDRSMFDYAQRLEPRLRADNTVVIGDDPWSEADFATACDLPCVIVDRRNRYQDVSLPPNVRRVRTLLELM